MSPVPDTAEVPIRGVRVSDLQTMWKGFIHYAATELSHFISNHLWESRKTNPTAFSRIACLGYGNALEGPPGSSGLGEFA